MRRYEIFLFLIILGLIYYSRLFRLIILCNMAAIRSSQAPSVLSKGTCTNLTTVCHFPFSLPANNSSVDLPRRPQWWADSRDRFCSRWYWIKTFRIVNFSKTNITIFTACTELVANQRWNDNHKILFSSFGRYKDDAIFQFRYFYLRLNYPRDLVTIFKNCLEMRIGFNFIDYYASQALLA